VVRHIIMSIKEARATLWSISDSLSDEQVNEMIALLRAIARIFITKNHEEKIVNTEE